METLEEELSQFLTPEANPALKVLAAENLMGLTGTEEGQAFLRNSDSLLSGVVVLASDRILEVKERALKTIINISGDDSTSWKILNFKSCEERMAEWLKQMTDSSYRNADLMCKMVSNLTRGEKCAERVSKWILNGKDDSNCVIEKMVLALCTVKYNEHADLHYMAAVLSNLSQIREIRAFIMDKEKCIFQRLLPFTESQGSIIRRRGVIGVLKNCCFDTGLYGFISSTCTFPNFQLHSACELIIS